jgi:hypothetical protein
MITCFLLAYSVLYGKSAVGKVSVISGKPTVKRANTTKWALLKKNDKVYDNDELKTTSKASIKIKLLNKKIVSIKPNTQIKMSKLISSS